MPTFGKKTIIRENRSLNLDKVPNDDFTLRDYLFSAKDEKQDTDTKLEML